MCLILFGWNAHPNYPLIVAANRDEFYARPTAAAHWWNDNLLLGGQDLESGGTWLGITPQGRFAALTNHRDFYNRVEGDRSRGLLVTDALASSGNPDHFLSQISEQQICYQPFNLLLADGNSLFCYESRNRLTKKITSGIHALSNADLDTEWPKVERGKVRLATAIRENKIDSESLFSILSNREKAPKISLPDTGIGEEWEHNLSPCFIETEEYGTRSSTVLLVDSTGKIDLYERRYLPLGEQQGDIHFTFNIPTQVSR